jgi:hypothetical protein
MLSKTRRLFEDEDEVSEWMNEERERELDDGNYLWCCKKKKRKKKLGKGFSTDVGSNTSPFEFIHSLPT